MAEQERYGCVSVEGRTFDFSCRSLTKEEQEGVMTASFEVAELLLRADTVIKTMFDKKVAGGLPDPSSGVLLPQIIAHLIVAVDYLSRTQGRNVLKTEMALFQLSNFVSDSFRRAMGDEKITKQ